MGGNRAKCECYGTPTSVTVSGGWQGENCSNVGKKMRRLCLVRVASIFTSQEWEALVPIRLRRADAVPPPWSGPAWAWLSLAGSFRGHFFGRLRGPLVAFW